MRERGVAYGTVETMRGLENRQYVELIALLHVALSQGANGIHPVSSLPGRRLK